MERLNSATVRISASPKPGQRWRATLIITHRDCYDIYSTAKQQLTM